MDSKYMKLIEAHKSQFLKFVDVEKVLPQLKQSEVLSPAEVASITGVDGEGGPAAKTAKLLEVLATKDSEDFQALRVALENTYPHLLTVMFPWATKDPQSLTSDSDEDAATSPPALPPEDDPGGGGGSQVLLRSYPPLHPHPAAHPPHPRPMSLHEIDFRQNSVSMLKAELKLVASDRDVIRDDRDLLRDELSSKNMQSKIEPRKHIMATDLRRSAEATGKGINPIGAGAGVSVPAERTGFFTGSDIVLGPIEKHRDYDRLQSKCDLVGKELQSLRQQHVETVNKCDKALKEADMYRSKYKLTKDKMEQTINEMTAIRAQCKAILADKQRYEQEVIDLQRVHKQDQLEIEELQKQQREALSESGSSEVYTMYDATLDKYKYMKQENENLRQRYNDLSVQHNANLSKLEMSQEETKRLRTRYEEVVADLNSGILERKGLQQQCTAAIMKWHNALHETREAEKDLQKSKMERDEYKKGQKQAISETIKTSKDIGRLRSERNAVVHEYTLVMSERDAVHREMEQLQDKLTDLEKRYSQSETEKKTARVELETLREELTSVVHDRDNTHKLLADLQQKVGMEKATQKLEGSERELALLDSRESDSLRMANSYDAIKKEGAESREQLNKETEALRVKIEQIQTELNDALSEAETSKRRRDWAFSERDKIVLERESIKTLCDELRRERDRAVSEQAQALRDLDELKKQKNEAMKELKDTKEKYETLVEKEARKNQLNSVGHNHSRDSAIDADLQEWETETLELELGTVSKDDLGFDIVGGKDDPQYPNDNSIFISNITKNGNAHGKLKVNDQLIKINNVDVTNVAKTMALQAAKSGGSVINMVVRRRKSSTTRPIQPVHLHLTGSRELGISIESGLYISRILPGSVAAKEGNLAVGDRILNVNGQSVENLSVGEVLRLVEEGGDHIVFSVLKYTPTPLPSLVSSSASSGQILTESSPEAPSTSPKSPRNQLWVTTSPDTMKASSNIKSSGSQTDSLDSPQGVSSHSRSENSDVDSGGGVKIHNVMLPDRVYAKVFDGMYNSSRNDHHDINVRTASSKHPMVMSAPAEPASQTDEAQDVVEEIQAIIKQQQSKTPLMPNTKRSRRDKEIENGGTWPKCRPVSDYPMIHGPSGYTSTIGKKERPPLAPLVNENQFVSASLIGSPTSPPANSLSGKVPPTPPERSDSFNRGASIKHSPQNSDSLVKYNHSKHNHVNIANKASPYISASPSKQSSGHAVVVNTGLNLSSMNPVHRTPVSTSLEIKSSSGGLGGDRGDQGSRDRDSHERDPHKQTVLHSGMHFPNSSTPDSSSSSNSQTMDTTVVSAKLNPKDQLDFIRRPRSNRPTSAPSRGRKDRMESANMVHTSLPQKPKSLAVKSMYSPRPLPPSGGQNIVPSQGMAFRGGFSSPTTVKSNSSSGSIGQRSVDGFPLYRGRTPPITHMMRSPQQPFQPLPHRSSPSSLPTSLPSPAFSNMSSSLASPTSSQAMSPRYTTVNGHISRPDVLETSDTDGGVLDDRLNTPSPSPSQQSSSFNQSSQTLSDDFPAYHQRNVLPWNSRPASHDPSSDGYSTLPNVRQRHYQGERIHSSATHSLMSSKSSIEKGSDRGSPISPCNFMPNQSNSLPATMRHKIPQVGETRNIHVEKSHGPLGINIDPSSTGGIFVSSVSENSLAAHAGIEVGDQLLEVCGINMRNAPFNLAASVLRQCRDSITMLVQYNPEKYRVEESSDEPSSPESSANNTPQTSRTRQGSMRVGSDVSTITPQSLTPQSMSPSHSTKPVPAEGNYMPCEPRFVFLKRNSPQESLGIRLVGGNAVGIFVHNVAPNSSASGPVGLRCGDQILEFNGVNLRSSTAEQADHEISKPSENVAILAQYNIAKYNAVQDQPGDAIYARALCDHDGEMEGELHFKKDDILYVDNTLYQGMPGVWRAWLVDDEGNKLKCGTIPSKSRMEDELAQKRSLSDILHDDELKGSRRGSASARRSFFRRKKHTRNNSKDSRELNSFSDASINSDSIPFLDDGATMPFLRVERLDCMVLRPVLIIGPLSEPLIEKLTSESPDKYCRCQPEIVKVTQSSLETGRDKGVFVDFQRRDSHYECVRADTVKEIIDKNRHAMLNCSPEAIEVLHKVQIYPIVLYIKHKSPKQIREVKDTRFMPEKLTNKVAKELHEQFAEYETKYKHLFSEIIPGGNLAYMSVNIKGAIDKQQKKTLWIPAGSI